MAKTASASTPAETPAKTAHEKMALRPRSKLTMKQSSTAKRPKMAAAKKKASKLDANKPKKPPTAFFYFLEDFRKEFQEQNPDVKSMREIGKACGEKWKIMTYEEKVEYYDVATVKRAEFEKAMADYINKKESGEYDEFDEDSDFDE
ncbi:high mobility group B protein 14 [Cynara cardunculus var. scolymus]|uniref:High mobility group (HMG) box domain-containing protein n=1 Tax=Cynara cardunculus var. scolymus TaxID=59895 RepID=A0A103XEK3_CYNCS|nr:high mobility group B protein 14 [Cynara cardunculus var. scolymus]KVH89300.1 High mobility group (HMG) box domain-containing protein [Cynara cardunculus var. scolymus]